MEYTRVIPRDLFNEAKLLKCMGRLCLLIHDRQTPVEMFVDHNGDAFNIDLIETGHLTITNLTILIKDQPFTFMTDYNNKENYPLTLYADYCEYVVFNDDGEFCEEFISFCHKLELVQ